MLGRLGYFSFQWQTMSYTSLPLVVLWLVTHLDPNGSAGVPVVPVTISMSANTYPNCLQGVPEKSFS